MPNQYTDNSRKDFEQFFGRKIEEYDSIKRAVQSLGESSQQSYYRELPRYFIFLKEEPDQVIKNRRKQIADDNPDKMEYYEQQTRAYIKLLKDKALAGRGINSCIGRIQGFFSNNSKRYSLDLGHIKISKARKRQKYSPSIEQVKKILSVADSRRDRLLITLVYHTGCAPIDASKLLVSDIPVEAWSYFEKTRSKTGEVWRGVTTPDLAEELKAYLQARGEYKPGELLFKSREGYLDNDAISRVIADLIVKAGFKDVAGFKPTSFRDAFEDALVDSNTNPKIKATLMAHVSDIEHQYGSYNRMVERLVEAMKATYPFICLNDSLRSPAELAGFSSEDVAQIKDMLRLKDRIVTVFKMLENGELVHVDDPELPRKLREAGKIP